MTEAKQEPAYHGIIPPKLLPPGQVPCYYVSCRCDRPRLWQRVTLLLDARKVAWGGRVRALWAGALGRRGGLEDAELCFEVSHRDVKVRHIYRVRDAGADTCVIMLPCPKFDARRQRRQDVSVCRKP